MTTGQPTSDPTRVVLVTGSARGLGRATAAAFRAAGERVHVVWRESSDLVAGLERDFPGRVHQADLTRGEQAQRVVAAVLARDGRLDAMVHAVGAYASGPLHAARAETFEDLVASNTTSALRVMNAARAALRSSRGAALFFGCAGLDGHRARRETALYSSAKSALLVLVRSWALEEAPHGVRVNSLSPGIVPHPHADRDTLDPERIARVPAGRATTPDEVATVAVFLCSDGARSVTGADVPVAGGWML